MNSTEYFEELENSISNRDLESLKNYLRYLKNLQDAALKEKVKYREPNNKEISFSETKNSKIKIEIKKLIENDPLHFILDEFKGFSLSDQIKLIPHGSYYKILCKVIVYTEEELRETNRKIKIHSLSTVIDKADSNESNKATNKIEIPTVKSFIQTYLHENSINLKDIANKSSLEREICEDWKIKYPGHPRRLSTFHRELPRRY